MRNIVVNMGVRYRKVAMLEDNKLVDFYIEDLNSKNHSDNIYFGIVKDSVKKFESVFINIGEDKNAYLQIDNTDKLPLVGEKVLVQVVKDETDTKGVAVSRNLSISGRYIVIVDNNSGKNIPKSKVMFSNDFDKKLTSDYRKKFEEILKGEKISIIIRKEAMNIDIKYVEKEYFYLKKKIDSIYNDFEKFKEDKNDKNARLVYKKDIYQIILNEFYNRSTESIVVDSNKAFETLKFMLEDYGLDTNIVREYNKDNELSLFESYKIDDELRKALGKYAWLKSGGQIIIEHTEALTVIDVNSSKFAGKKAIEESSFKVNIEAAHEIARQIRLRNISGIIIVDFINMKSDENKKKLLDELKEVTKEDKLKVNVLGITALGLVEMTRQKKRKMLKDIIKGV